MQRVENDLCKILQKYPIVRPNIKTGRFLWVGQRPQNTISVKGMREAARISQGLLCPPNFDRRGNANNPGFSGRRAWRCNFSSAVRNVEWFLSLSGTILKVAYFYISQLPLKVTMKCLATWFDAYPFPCKVIVSDYHLWEMGISISDFLARGRKRRDWIAVSEQRWKARKRGRANKSFHLVSPSLSPCSPVRGEE